MPAGRPTLYRPEYCEQLIAHRKQGLSFESFAAVVGVGRNTLYEWEKAHEEFRDAKARALGECLIFHEKLGIEGIYDTTTVEGEGKEKVTTIKRMNANVWRLFMVNLFQWRGGNQQEGPAIDPKTLLETLAANPTAQRRLAELLAAQGLQVVTAQAQEQRAN